MRQVDADVERYLSLLRNKIRERGFSQLEVQAALSWGRSYLSQLLTKQKKLRLEQVLMILDVIGIAPAEFFAELYFPGGASRSFRPPTNAGSEKLRQQIERFRALLEGLVGLLVEKGIVNADDLRATAEAIAAGGDQQCGSRLEVLPQ